MSRKHYLITYDVSDDKRRTKLFKTLRDHGDHAQYSVFLCELSARELESLRGRMRELIHQREDQILILDLGTTENPLDKGLECLGKSYEPAKRVVVV